MDKYQALFSSCLAYMLPYAIKYQTHFTSLNCQFPQVDEYIKYLKVEGLMNLEFPHAFPDAYTLSCNWLPSPLPFAPTWNWEALPSSFIAINHHANSFTSDSKQVTKSSSALPRVENLILKGSFKVAEKKQNRVEKMSGEGKKRKRAVQKESRNVVSNIFRVFLRNLIEYKSYDRQIRQILAKWELPLQIEDFYRWVETFQISYRGYIRLAQLENILKNDDRIDCKRVILHLLSHFLKGEGLTHCLTSKRIGLRAVELHLRGLRQLQTQLKGSISK